MKQEEVLIPLKPKKEKIIVDNGFTAQILLDGQAHTVHPKQMYHDIFFAVINDDLYAFQEKQSPIFAYKLLKRFKLDIFCLDTKKAVPENFIDTFSKMIGPPPGYTKMETIKEFIETPMKNNAAYKAFTREVYNHIKNLIPPNFIHTSETQQINHLSASSEFLYESLEVFNSSRFYGNLVQFRQTARPSSMLILIIIGIIAMMAIVGGIYFMEYGGAPSIPGFGQFGKSPDQLFMEQYSPEEAKAALDRGEIELNDIPAAMRPGIQNLEIETGTVNIADPDEPFMFEFDLFGTSPDEPEEIEIPPGQEATAVVEIPPPTVTPAGGDGN